jgi:DNA-binding transcriptional MerR regulator
MAGTLGKVRVQKRLYYKIGEACKALGIQPYVLRYWETEFPALAPSKSRSGQRVYSEKELEIIRRIKELLYSEGYTIAGAKKKLETDLASGPLSELEEDPAAQATEPAEPPKPVTAPPPSSPPRRSRPQPRSAEPAAEPVPALPETPQGVESAEPGPYGGEETAETVQKLRSGIARALREARDLLALLDAPRH